MTLEKCSKGIALLDFCDSADWGGAVTGTVVLSLERSRDESVRAITRAESGNASQLPGSKTCEAETLFKLARALGSS